MFDVFGTTLRLKLCKILENIGLLVPHTMMNNFEYIITLPASSDVLVTQTGEASADYSLENLHLEYETIMSDQLANEISSSFSTGRSLPYEHVTMFQKISWSKSLTIKNIDVNVPRKSVNAIVLLFKGDSNDNENFAYLNLKTVKISIEGKPNQLCYRDLTRASCMRRHIDCSQTR